MQLKVTLPKRRTTKVGVDPVNETSIIKVRILNTLADAIATKAVGVLREEAAEDMLAGISEAEVMDGVAFRVSSG